MCPIVKSWEILHYKTPWSNPRLPFHFLSHHSLPVAPLKSHAFPHHLDIHDMCESFLLPREPFLFLSDGWVPFRHASNVTSSKNTFSAWDEPSCFSGPQSTHCFVFSDSPTDNFLTRTETIIYTPHVCSIASHSTWHIVGGTQQTPCRGFDGWMNEWMNEDNWKHMILAHSCFSVDCGIKHTSSSSSTCLQHQPNSVSHVFI